VSCHPIGDHLNAVSLPEVKYKAVDNQRRKRGIMTADIEKIDVDEGVLDSNESEIISRRKVVKTIVGGAAAFAAYNALPAKWGTPIIEQVFIPVHAATSGGGTIQNLAVENVQGDETTTSVTVRISGQVSPPVAGQAVTLTITP